MSEVRNKVLRILSENFEDIHMVGVEDIEDCLGDLMSTYGIELEDVENMILYHNYDRKMDVINNSDGMQIIELVEVKK